MLKEIAVLGAGSWGTALAYRLAQNGLHVRLWGRHSEHMLALADSRENKRYLPGCILPESMTFYSDLSAAVDGISDILLVTPSHAFSEMLQALSPLLSQPRIAWASKGFDPETHGLLDGAVKKVFPNCVMAVLSGPSLAAEVGANLPTAVAVASNDAAFADDLVAAFHADTFRVYRNDDMTGVELCSALKNVLAIAAGIADGMGLGANARSALITRGLVEMRRLCACFSAQESTLMGLAGLGDLLLTATDDRSRNRRFGLAIGAGSSIDAAKGGIDQVIEGMQACFHLHKIILREGLDMPITSEVYAILYEGRQPEEALSRLLWRQAKVEL